jgi:hypothetical protein
VLQIAYTHFGTLAVQGPTAGADPPWTAEVTVVAGRIVRVE